jgi:hypothetical protein
VVVSIILGFADDGNVLASPVTVRFSFHSSVLSPKYMYMGFAHYPKEEKGENCILFVVMSGVAFLFFGHALG